MTIIETKQRGVIAQMSYKLGDQNITLTVKRRANKSRDYVVTKHYEYTVYEVIDDTDVVHYDNELLIENDYVIATYTLDMMYEANNGKYAEDEVRTDKELWDKYLRNLIKYFTKSYNNEQAYWELKDSYNYHSEEYDDEVDYVALLESMKNDTKVETGNRNWNGVIVNATSHAEPNNDKWEVVLTDTNGNYIDAYYVPYIAECDFEGYPVRYYTRWDALNNF